MQATLKKTVRLDGVGLHSGAPARLEMHPAPAGHGIVFRRVDLATARDIPARWDNVIPSKLCTLLEGEGGVTLSTVEHVMAALVGTGIQNLLIEVDGPEVPILDGSAAPFVRAILRAGIALQNTPLRAIRVLRPVE
nr:UDP-3-O-acyl-N-acetylglucosamine deacetylase [Paracoccus sp. (in: a-proteobacteria)]